MATRKNNSLILSEVKAQIEESQTFQAKLRKAVFDAVSESDVVDVVKGLVTRAKEGDEKATKMLFDYVIGGAQSTTLTQNNYYERADVDDPPMPALNGQPGSTNRLEELQRRAVNGKKLF